MRSIALAAALPFVLSCAGQGSGTVSGTVNIPVCELGGAYDLHASFFGANRYGGSLSIRIQNGGGTEDYSDSLVITVDDTEAVQRLIAQSPTHDATLPVGPSGAPGVIVHAMFLPNHSCGRERDSRLGQVIGLWADSDPTQGLQSTITFRSVDNPGGTNAAGDEHLTDVSSFSFFVHDPRPIGPAPLDNPRPESFNGVPITDDTPAGSAMLSGSFRFEYSRAVPSQFFP